MRVAPDELLESPHIFIGSVDSFVEKFQRLRRELGISSIMVGEVGEMAPVVERLAGTWSRGGGPGAWCKVRPIRAHLHRPTCPGADGERQDEAARPRVQRHR